MDTAWDSPQRVTMGFHAESPWKFHGVFGGGEGRSGAMGSRSPRCFSLILPKRSIPKPDQHRKDYTTRVVRH